MVTAVTSRRLKCKNELIKEELIFFLLSPPSLPLPPFQGRDFDAQGIMRNWWNNKTTEEFNNRQEKRMQ